MINKRISVLLLIITIALLISVSINVFLYKKTNQFYRRYTEIRIDPLGIGDYHLKAKNIISKTPDTRRIVIYGDSRAHQWRAPKISGLEFINRGIGGQTSSQVLARFDHHIAPAKPDTIVLQVGVNDLKAIAILPDRKRQIISNCKSNIEKIVSRSLELGSDVIITTIFPIGNLPDESVFFWSDEVDAAIKEVNDFIYSLEGPNIIIIDSAAILADEKGIVHNRFIKNFLHINNAGYSAMNSALLNALSSTDKRPEGINDLNQGVK